MEPSVPEVADGACCERDEGMHNVHSLLNNSKTSMTNHKNRSVGRVSRAKWPTFLKCSHKVQFARRSDARLPYPTLTGWHQVCITRQDDPALRLPTNRGRENYLSTSSVPPQRPPHPEVGQITRYTGLGKLLG